MTEPSRFVDDGRTLLDFAGEVLVECPRCRGRAVVVPLLYDDDQVAMAPHWMEPRRLVCPACGLTRDWTDRHATYGGPVDPYFRLPLLLQVPCCGHVLWAFNADHLDHLRRFVTATHRERRERDGRTMSLVERLPAWMIAGKNRSAVTKSLHRLAELLARPDGEGGRERDR